MKNVFGVSKYILLDVRDKILHLKLDKIIHLKWRPSGYNSSFKMKNLWDKINHFKFNAKYLTFVMQTKNKCKCKIANLIFVMNAKKINEK